MRPDMREGQRVLARVRRTVGTAGVPGCDAYATKGWAERSRETHARRRSTMKGKEVEW